MTLTAQSNVTHCRPLAGNEINCRTPADDGSVKLQTYRQNPFGEGYQADHHGQRSTGILSYGDRALADPLPPPVPIPPVKLPTTKPQETWKPRQAATPSEAFLK